MISTPAPVTSRAVRSTSRIWACTVTSSAVVGSSQISRSGSLAIAIAITTRWRSPPDSSCGNALARVGACAMPTSSSSSTARLRASARRTSGLCTSMASAIWSPMVYTGVSADIGSWNMVPIDLPRIRDIAWSDSPSSSLPCKRTDPDTSAYSGSSPMTAIAAVLLPEPDSPTMATTSPGSMWYVVPRTADTATSPVSKVTFRSVTSSSAVTCLIGARASCGGVACYGDPTRRAGRRR